MTDLRTFGTGDHDTALAERYDEVLFETVYAVSVLAVYE
jgi:hypothetical protein